MNFPKNFVSLFGRVNWFWFNKINNFKVRLNNVADNGGY